MILICSKIEQLSKIKGAKFDQLVKQKVLKLTGVIDLTRGVNQPQRPTLQQVKILLYAKRCVT